MEDGPGQIAADPNSRTLATISVQSLEAPVGQRTPWAAGNPPTGGRTFLRGARGFGDNPA